MLRINVNTGEMMWFWTGPMKSKYELFAWLRLFVAGDIDSRLRETLRSDCYRFPRQEKQNVKNGFAEINHQRPARSSRWRSFHEWAETFPLVRLTGQKHDPVKIFEWSGCSVEEESFIGLPIRSCCFCSAFLLRWNGSVKNLNCWALFKKDVRQKKKKVQQGE